MPHLELKGSVYHIENFVFELTKKKKREMASYFYLQKPESTQQRIHKSAYKGV